MKKIGRHFFSTRLTLRQIIQWVKNLEGANAVIFDPNQKVYSDSNKTTLAEVGDFVRAWESVDGNLTFTEFQQDKSILREDQNGDKYIESSGNGALKLEYNIDINSFLLGYIAITDNNEINPDSGDLMIRNPAGTFDNYIYYQWGGDDTGKTNLRIKKGGTTNNLNAKISYYNQEPGYQTRLPNELRESYIVLDSGQIEYGVLNKTDIKDADPIGLESGVYEVIIPWSSTNYFYGLYLSNDISLVNTAFPGIQDSFFNMPIRSNSSISIIEDYMQGQYGTSGNFVGNSNQRRAGLPRIVTYNSIQYAFIYNWNGYPQLFFRNSYDSSWSILSFDNINNGDLPAYIDNHKGISFEFDRDGYLHVIYNTHQNVPFHYFKSNNPVGTWSGGIEEELQIGNSGSVKNSYPTFFKRPDTNALIHYKRQGGSQNSTYVFYEYDESTESWAELFDLFTEDGDGKYLCQPFGFDSNFGSGGFMHIIFCFNLGAATPVRRNRVSAIKWDGSNFYDYAGNQQSPPFNYDGQNFTIIDDEEHDGLRTLRSPIEMIADGQPATIDQHEDENSNLQLYLLYYDGSNWQESQITTNGTFSQSENGNERIYNVPEMPELLVDSSGIIHVFARDMQGNQLLTHWHDDGTKSNWTEETLLFDPIPGTDIFYDREQFKQTGAIDLLMFPIKEDVMGAPAILYRWSES